MYYLSLVIALILNTSANILLKMGSAKLGAIKGLSILDLTFKLATNYFLILGFALFVLNALFYILALTKINISIAYPLMTSASFLIISFFSIFYFKESITATQILGILFIVIGITLVAYNIK